MDGMDSEDSKTLARIDERTQAHTRDFAQHVKDDTDDRKETNDKFDKVFKFMSDKFDKLDKKVDDGFKELNLKIEPLKTESDQRKGATIFSKVLASSAYGIIAIIAGYLGGHGGHN